MKKDLNFKDRTIVITGGATGIGYATAKAFYLLDANIVICGRTESKLIEAEKSLFNTRKKTQNIVYK